MKCAFGSWGICGGPAKVGAYGGCCGSEVSREARVSAIDGPRTTDL